MSPACRDNDEATRIPGKIRLWIAAAVPSNSPKLDGMSLNTSQPFTRAEALAAGFTDVDLRSRRFQRLFHGLYLRSGIKIGVHQMAAAALHISPRGSYASHETAAALWGASVGDFNEVHVSVPKGSSRTERRGIVAQRATTDQNPRLCKGLLVSEPTRVFLELAAARMDLLDLVALGDSLVRRKRTTPAALVEAADGYVGKGSRLARRAASYVRAGVDSPRESRLRLLMVLGGLPEPRVNYILRELNGDWSQRLDLCYPELKLIIEYDGRHHTEVRANWLKDIKRREALEREGWRLVIVTAEGLYDEPLDTLQRVRLALNERGWHQRSRRIPAEWHRLFTDRPAAN
jgi:Protein of unknown function (DUF559)